MKRFDTPNFENTEFEAVAYLTEASNGSYKCPKCGGNMKKHDNGKNNHYQCESCGHRNW